MDSAEREYWLGQLVDDLREAADGLRAMGQDADARRADAIADRACDELSTLYRGESA